MPKSEMKYGLNWADGNLNVAGKWQYKVLMMRRSKRTSKST